MTYTITPTTITVASLTELLIMDGQIDSAIKSKSRSKELNTDDELRQLYDQRKLVLDEMDRRNQEESDESA